MLQALAAMPGVAGVRRENSHVSIELKASAEIWLLVNFLVGAGVQIEGVDKNVKGLEDVFLDLMQEDQEGAK